MARLSVTLLLTGLLLLNLAGARQIRPYSQTPLVLLFSDHSQPSISFQPHWDHVTGRSENAQLHFEQWYCSESPSVCQDLPIESFPEVYLFLNGVGYRWNGPYLAADLQRFLNALAPSPIEAKPISGDTQRLFIPKNVPRRIVDYFAHVRRFYGIPVVQGHYDTISANLFGREFTFTGLVTDFDAVEDFVQGLTQWFVPETGPLAKCAAVLLSRTNDTVYLSEFSRLSTLSMFQGKALSFLNYDRWSRSLPKNISVPSLFLYQGESLDIHPIASVTELKPYLEGAVLDARSSFSQNTVFLTPYSILNRYTIKDDSQHIRYPLLLLLIVSLAVGLAFLSFRDANTHAEKQL